MVNQTYLEIDKSIYDAKKKKKTYFKAYLVIFKII